MTRYQRQQGFAYIAAVVFLVVIAGISVAMLQLTNTQQATVNQALLTARASLAARGGIEWVLQNPAARCAGPAANAVGATPAVTPVVTDLADFVADAGFRVRVTCSFRNFREGEALVSASQPPVAVLKRMYRIEAVACNGGGACPDTTAVTRPDYVERARVATICMVGNDPCY